MAGLTVTLICVAAAGLLVVMQWEVWVRGDQRLTIDLIKSRIRQVQRYCRFLSSGSTHFFQLSPGFSIALNPRGIMGSVGRKVGSAWEVKVLHCINVSETGFLHQKSYKIQGLSRPFLPTIQGTSSNHSIALSLISNNVDQKTWSTCCCSTQCHALICQLQKEIQ